MAKYRRFPSKNAIKLDPWTTQISNGFAAAVAAVTSRKFTQTVWKLAPQQAQIMNKLKSESKENKYGYLVDPTGYGCPNKARHLN